MNMDLASTFFKYRKAIIIVAINIAGLLVIFGGIYLIRIAAVGPIPDPQTSSPQKVVEFLSDEKVIILPKTTKRKYLEQVIRYYSASPQRRLKFTKAIHNLPDSRIRQLKENLFSVAKDQVVDYAREYSRLESYQQRKAYIDQRLNELKSLEAVVKGKPMHSSRGKSSKGQKGVDLTKDARLAKDIPTSPGGIYKKFIEKTRPADRARLETFVNDVQSRAKQLKAMKKF